MTSTLGWVSVLRTREDAGLTESITSSGYGTREEETMITTSNVRDNGMIHPPVIRQLPPWEAFTALVRYEIGLRAQFTEIDSGRIVCVTTVFGCVDTVTFTGSVDEMEALVRAAICARQIRGESSVQLARSVLPSVPRIGRAFSPSDVASIGAFLVGVSTARLAALLATGIEPTRQIASLDDEVFYTLCETHLATGFPVDEILAELVSA